MLFQLLELNVLDALHRVATGRALSVVLRYFFHLLVGDDFDRLSHAVVQLTPMTLASVATCARQ